jgi:hypothetical protein
MAGQVVTVSSLDSVRIEVPGVGRVVTLPVSVLLDVHAVLKHCLRECEGLDLEHVSEGAGAWEGWEAMAGNAVAHGETPWGAIMALARALGARGR